MNKRIAAIVLLLLVLLLALPVAAQDPTETPEPTPTPRPTVELPTVDPPPGMNPVLAAVANRDLLIMRRLVGRAQLGYRQRLGEYWQAAATHRRPPRPGNLGTPNPLAAVDGPAWDDMGIGLYQDLAVSVRVDVYDGPRGRGWVMVGQIEDLQGHVWERALNVGPEKWREYNWRVAP